MNTLTKIIVAFVLIYFLPRILITLFEFFEIPYTIYITYVAWTVTILLFFIILSEDKSMF